MKTARLDSAIAALAPLIARGYCVETQFAAERHFEDVTVVVARDESRVRVMSDRGQWFVDVGPGPSAAEWFDARLVLRQIGADEDGGTDLTAVKEVCARLAETEQRWLPLLSGDGCKRLRERQLEIARERFGYAPEQQ